MEMCYTGGALAMPSNCEVIGEDEMMYVEGGGTVTHTRASANAYLAQAQAACRVGALCAGAGTISCATIGLPGAVFAVGLNVGASTLWSWADAYATARECLRSKIFVGAKKVEVIQTRKGFHLSVTVRRKK